jgi:hypothetical protein
MVLNKLTTGTILPLPLMSTYSAEQLSNPYYTSRIIFDSGIYCDVLAFRQRSGLAKHDSPATFGSVDNNRIAPVSIQRKPLHNNRGMQLLYNRCVGIVSITT